MKQFANIREMNAFQKFSSSHFGNGIGHWEVIKILRTICDLCGKEISGIDKEEHRIFKIKERKGCFDFSSWNYIDAHQTCIKKLLNGAKIANEPPMGGSCMTDD